MLTVSAVEGVDGYQARIRSAMSWGSTRGRCEAAATFAAIEECEALRVSVSPTQFTCAHTFAKAPCAKTRPMELHSLAE